MSVDFAHTNPYVKRKMPGPVRSRRAQAKPVSRKEDPRPRDEMAQETREALIDAAMVAFSDEGLDTPSLDSICERAGYTRGAFYVHFKDRDELIAAVMQKARASLIDALVPLGEHALTLEQIVTQLAEAIAVGVYPPKYGAVRHHHFMDACARSPTIRRQQVAHMEVIRERLALSVRNGQSAGTIRGDLDAVATAEALLATVGGVELMVELGFPMDPRALAANWLRMLAARS